MCRCVGILAGRQCSGLWRAPRTSSPPVPAAVPQQQGLLLPSDQPSRSLAFCPWLLGAGDEGLVPASEAVGCREDGHVGRSEGEGRTDLVGKSRSQALSWRTWKMAPQVLYTQVSFHLPAFQGIRACAGLF